MGQRIWPCTVIGVMGLLGLGSAGWAQQADDATRGREYRGASFAESLFEDCDFARAAIRNSKADYLAVYGVSSQSPVWENLVLQRPRLKSLQLCDAQWQGGKLSGSLEGLQAPGLKISRCSARDLEIDSTEVRGLSCHRVDVWDLAVWGMRADGARVEQFVARDSRWSNADLSGSRLERVDLGSARLDRCELDGARLDHCSLRDVKLSGCEIRGLEIDGYDIEQLIREARRR